MRGPRPTPDPETLRTALDAVGEVYAELDRRPVGRDCRLRADCCHFLRTGRTPYLTAGEALYAARALRASGRRELPERTDGACPLLDPAGLRCRIHAGRPFGCRTHFCEAAGGPMDRRGVIDLIHRLEEIDRRLGGVGGRALPGAVAAALERLPRRGPGRRGPPPAA